MTRTPAHYALSRAPACTSSASSLLFCYLYRLSLVECLIAPLLLWTWLCAVVVGVAKCFFVAIVEFIAVVVYAAMLSDVFDKWKRQWLLDRSLYPSGGKAPCTLTAKNSLPKFTSKTRTKEDTTRTLGAEGTKSHPCARKRKFRRGSESHAKTFLCVFTHLPKLHLQDHSTKSLI